MEHGVVHAIHFKLGKTNLTPSKDEPLASWQLVTVSFLDCVQDDINSMVQGFSLESHAKLFHDSRGAFVLSPSNRNNPMQAAATESVFQHLGSCLGGKSLTPELRGKPLPDFDSREVVKGLKPAKPSDLLLSLPRKFPEAIPKGTKMSSLTLHEFDNSGVRPRDPFRDVLHDARIGCYRAKFAPIFGLPGKEYNSFSFKLLRRHFRAF